MYRLHGGLHTILDHLLYAALHDIHTLIETCQCKLFFTAVGHLVWFFVDRNLILVDRDLIAGFLRFRDS